MIKRKISRKLKQLITTEKIKSCSKNKIQSWYPTVLFMDSIFIPLNIDLTKKYDMTTLGEWGKEKCVCVRVHMRVRAFVCRVLYKRINWHTQY